jgi:hypothetical protein
VVIIIRKFLCDAKVKIIGKEGVYQVKTCKQIIYHTQGKMIEYNTYELMDIDTKECISGYIPEDHLISYNAQTSSMTKDNLDTWLDKYNDLMGMYKQFNDETYKFMADDILNLLKFYTMEK